MTGKTLMLFITGMLLIIIGAIVYRHEIIESIVYRHEPYHLYSFFMFTSGLILVTLFFIRWYKEMCMTFE